jgi:hypothetical protein
MLDDLQQRGVIRGQWRDYIGVAGSLEELTALLEGEPQAASTGKALEPQVAR